MVANVTNNGRKIATVPVWPARAEPRFFYILLSKDDISRIYLLKIRLNAKRERANQRVCTSRGEMGEGDSSSMSNLT